MNYDQAIAFLESKKHLGSNLGLLRVEQLCALLGDPQKALNIVHVAGTNGKGSICALAASALRAAGYRTGLYLSPYLEDFRECMQIDGEWIATDELARLMDRVASAVQALESRGLFPTEYEIATALAFLYYRENGCDAVVLETGLGGTLDATNVIGPPLVSVIAAIAYDHVQILGGTLELIARAKCGILKRGSAAVAYPIQEPEAMDVIVSRAAEEEIPLIVPDLSALVVEDSSLSGTRLRYKGLTLFTPLSGEHQVYNAVTALEALFQLRSCGFTLTDDAIVRGFAAVRHGARQEILCESPLILLDGAHNDQGMRALVKTIDRYVPQRPLVVVMGMLADKDYESAIGALAPLCDCFLAVRPPNPRALAPERAAEVARRFVADARAFEDFRSAIACALDLCGSSGAIVICGSLYQAAALKKVVREILCGASRPTPPPGA